MRKAAVLSPQLDIDARILESKENVAGQLPLVKQAEEQFIMGRDGFGWGSGASFRKRRKSRMIEKRINIEFECAEFQVARLVGCQDLVFLKVLLVRDMLVQVIRQKYRLAIGQRQMVTRSRQIFRGLISALYVDRLSAGCRAI